MQIKQIPVGVLQANCYILSKDNLAIIIDPGDEEERIEKELNGLKLVGILVTHKHFDHIGALNYFEKKYNLKHNEKIDNFKYEVLETLGHSKDAKTFYFLEEKVMFTGDFLFKGTIGRMDLEGGNVLDMQKSLEMIFKYQDDIKVFPGHGECTTLGEEKKLYM